MIRNKKRFQKTKLNNILYFYIFLSILLYVYRDIKIALFFLRLCKLFCITNQFRQLMSNNF